MPWGASVSTLREMEARKERATVVRRLLRWYFRRSSPWVTYSVGIDFTAASAYLERLSTALPGLTVQHLLAGAVGRALHAVPEANRRIVAGRTVREEEVSIAIPVHLLGQPGGSRELSLAFLRSAQRLSLAEIVEELSRTVQQERRGEAVNPLLRQLIWLGDRLPARAVQASLSTLALLLEVPAIAREFYRRVPITTMLTNVGSVVRGAEGLEGTFIRGGTLQIPTEPIHFTTFWGVGPLQDEVVARGGEPVVTRVLPMVLLFDHRLLDGARAGELLLRFAAILQDPAATFGDDGRLH